MTSTELDRRFAETARQAREDAGISQAQLAKMMSAYGFPWHQSTVWRKEAGRSQVALSEAAALAAILKFDMNLADIGKDFGTVCEACADNPPKNFSCNVCGRSGS